MFDNNAFSTDWALESGRFANIGGYVRPASRDVARQICEALGRSYHDPGQIYIKPANRLDTEALVVGGQDYSLRELLDVFHAMSDYEKRTRDLNLNPSSAPTTIEEWLEQRGLPSQLGGQRVTLAQRPIKRRDGSAVIGGDGRIVRQSVLTFVYRDGSEHSFALDGGVWWDNYGRNGLLWNGRNERLDDPSPSSVYLCEGEKDALALGQFGYEALGVPGADAFTQRMADRLSSWLGDRELCVAFDNDAAGQRGANKVLRLMREAGWNGRIWFIDWSAVEQARGHSLPKGFDVCDLLRGATPDDVGKWMGDSGYWTDSPSPTADSDRGTSGGKKAAAGGDGGGGRPGRGERLNAAYHMAMHWVRLEGSDVFLQRTDSGWYRLANELDMRCWLERASPGRYLGSEIISILETAKQLIPVVSAEKFVRHHIVGFTDGVLELDTGCFRPYRHAGGDESTDASESPDDADYVRSPAHAYVHDEEAVARAGAQFTELVRDLLGNPGDDVVNFALDHFAYITMIDYPRYHYWANFIGTGSNGKSLLLDILRKVVGERQAQSVDLRDWNRFTLGACLDARLLYVADANPKVADASVIKALSSDPYMRVERKFHSQVTIPNQWKLVVSSNEELISGDMSEGWQRRVVRYFFPNKYPMNPAFYEAWMSEDRIIPLATWLAQRACTVWQTNSLAVIPAAIDEARRAAMEQMDTVRMWWAERGEDIDRTHGGKIPVGAAYNDYRSWCEARGDSKSVSLRRFGGQTGRMAQALAGKYIYKVIHKSSFFVRLDPPTPPPSYPPPPKPVPSTSNSTGGTDPRPAPKAAAPARLGDVTEDGYVVTAIARSGIGDDNSLTVEELQPPRAAPTPEQLDVPDLLPPLPRGPDHPLLHRHKSPQETLYRPNP